MVDRKKTPDLLAAVLNEPVLLGEDEVDAEIKVEAKADPPKKLKAKAKQKPGEKTKAKSSSPASPPLMSTSPAWEYVEVTFREYDGWRPRLINGVELRGWKSQPVINDYLNQMGARGWEMVGMGEGRHSQREVYFKRPVPQKS